jgi:hypothetical protein
MNEMMANGASVSASVCVLFLFVFGGFATQKNGNVTDLFYCDRVIFEELKT